MMSHRATWALVLWTLTVYADMRLAAFTDLPRKTAFSTNEPLEIPGTLIEPGQYVFKLIESQPERNVLQVFETVQLWTADETRLVSTLLTMPNYDLPTTDKTVFSFFERGPKQPKALRLWFTPGRNYGQEFVYPKAQAVELARVVGRSVLSMPAELPGDIGKFARMVVEPGPTPAKVPFVPPSAGTAPGLEDSSLKSKAPTAPRMQARQSAETNRPREISQPQNAKTARQRPAESQGAPLSSAHARSQGEPTARNQPVARVSVLPKTASYLPLVAFIGLFSIFLSTLLHALMARLERS